MAHEASVKNMVSVKVLKEQIPALASVLKVIPDDAWAAVDDSGNLIIGLSLYTETSIPIQELQAFKGTDQEKWSALCMRGLLIQLERQIDGRMQKLSDVGEQLIRVIPLKKYG